MAANEKPSCESCPCLIDSNCQRDPTPVAIKSPKTYVCASHPDWAGYITGLRNFSNRNRGVINPWKKHNCKCGRIGESFHVEGLTTIQKTDQGSTLVFMNDCEDCKGTGIAPKLPARQF